ncbi:hypothetical protein RUM44_005938 [Polyplax serrata]|uniref:G-patch domain-containing protein n=1 Tax=Polyplax serrata TaxID=468196 RepID=A0ABR1AYH2_POLSC
MSRKQNSLMRFSRTERLAQLSEQEIVIEKKKREIQAKIEAQKKKDSEEALRKLEASEGTKSNKPGFSQKIASWKSDEYSKNQNTQNSGQEKKESILNAFSNDGSFLDQFKKLSQSNLSSSGTNKNNLDEEQHDGGNYYGDTFKHEKQCPERDSPYMDEKYLSDSSGVVNPSSQISSQTKQVMFQEPTNSSLNSNSKSTKNEVEISVPQTSYQKESCPGGHVQSSSNETSLASHLMQVPNSLHSSKAKSAIKGHSESISMSFKNKTVRKLDTTNPFEDDESNQGTVTEGSNLVKQPLANLSTTSEAVLTQDHDTSIALTKESGNSHTRLVQDEKETKHHHLAKMVATCGDDFEDSLRRRNQDDPALRFLFEKNSSQYISFRRLVLRYRHELNDRDNSSNSSEDDDCGSRESKRKKDRRRHREGSNEDESTSKVTSRHNRGRTVETLITDYGKFQDGGEDISYQKDLSSQGNAPRLNEPTNSGETQLPLDESDRLKSEERRKRKRKSRWGDAVPTTSNIQPPTLATNLNLQTPGKLPTPKTNLLSQLTRSDPGLIQYARQTFGSTNLSEEDWKKAEDHYKINLLYQDLVKKRAEIDKLERAGKFKYEYDSDEDVEGGTWEHKLRQQEMMATQLWAEELTRQAAGKHHIGDFLPPEELERFMEKYNAVKEGREPDLSDYKEFKLKEDNVGYRLLQKMGWSEGQGLGQDGSGIMNPVNKATTRHDNQGLGIERPDGLEAGDDEYDAYRKRMMLAYRFRPNPLNNPRRPYY